MTHRALHNCVRRNPTEARAEHMPQMVDRKVSYSRVLQRRLPGRLNRGDRLVGFDRTRKKKWALVCLFLLPTEKNIVCEPGQGHRLGCAFCLGFPSEENHVVI